MNEQIKCKFLANHLLFKTLSFNQIQQLSLHSICKKYKKGEIINYSHTSAPKIFLVCTGIVKIVTIQEDEEEVTREVIQKDDFFGAITLQNENVQSEFSVVLSNEAVVLSFQLNYFEDTMLKNPHIALIYTKHLGLKIKKMYVEYFKITKINAKDRLKNFFLQWGDNEGVFLGDKVVIINYLTQKEISDLIRVSRQTTTLLLKELEKEGILKYNRKS